MECSRCCCVTASTTSMSQPAMVTQNCGSLPGCERHPKQFFLATKTDGRTYDDAKRDIHRSLKRLGREQIDLIQLHNLVDPIDWDTALSPKGALEACIEAREQGLVRFIGVTGHGSQVAATHLRSLERFDFDTVMLPYNYLMMQDGHYAAMFNRLVAVCEERNVVVQTIKAIARRPWWGRDHTCATWYEPFNGAARHRRRGALGHGTCRSLLDDCRGHSPCCKGFRCR